MVVFILSSSLNSIPGRAKTSAMLLTAAMRQQRRAFFCRRSLWQKIAFSFGTFLMPVPIFYIGSEAKEKYDHVGRQYKAFRETLI